MEKKKLRPRLLQRTSPVNDSASGKNGDDADRLTQEQAADVWAATNAAQGLETPAATSEAQPGDQGGGGGGGGAAAPPGPPPRPLPRRRGAGRRPDRPPRAPARHDLRRQAGGVPRGWRPGAVLRTGWPASTRGTRTGRGLVESGHDATWRVHPDHRTGRATLHPLRCPHHHALCRATHDTGATVSDKTRKYFLAGQSGCGKTTLLKALAAREDRVVHWDIEDEYRGEQITFADIPRLAKRRAFCVVYRPHFARSLEDLPREFEQFAGLLLKYGRQLTVTIDEALSVLPRNRTSGGLGALLYQGRKRGLSVYYATQEISGLPRALTD